MGTAPGRSLLGVVIAAGVVGAVLVLANVHTPVRPGLALLFLLVVPTVAIAGLLRGFDRLSQMVLAVTADIVLLLLTATMMVALGIWSPRTGVLIVAAVAAVCLVVQWPPVARRLRRSDSVGASRSDDGSASSLEASSRA